MTLTLSTAAKASPLSKLVPTCRHAGSERNDGAVAPPWLAASGVVLVPTSGRSTKTTSPSSSWAKSEMPTLAVCCASTHSCSLVYLKLEGNVEKGRLVASTAGARRASPGRARAWWAHHRVGPARGEGGGA